MRGEVVHERVEPGDQQADEKAHVHEETHDEVLTIAGSAPVGQVDREPGFTGPLFGVHEGRWYAEPLRRALRQCWRAWPHNPHTHRGPKGKDSLATCRGVARTQDDFFLAR